MQNSKVFMPTGCKIAIQNFLCPTGAKIKYIYSLFLLMLLANFFILVPTKISLAIETGLKNTTDQIPAFKDATFSDTYFPTKIGQIIGVLLSFVGTVFFILIIYGGFLWMTAAGNEQNVTKAKGLITSAIIGLVIVLAAYAITSYVGTIVGQ
jgi:hypothetical protein